MPALCRDREFIVAIENLLSRQGVGQQGLSVLRQANDRAPSARQTSQGFLSRQSFLCRDRACTTPCRDKGPCVVTGSGAGMARQVAQCSRDRVQCARTVHTTDL